MAEHAGHKWRVAGFTPGDNGFKPLVHLYCKTKHCTATITAKIESIR